MPGGKSSCVGRLVPESRRRWATRPRIAEWAGRNVGAGRRSSADILVCGFWGLSSPQFTPAEKLTELESSVNPQAGKPALRAGVLLERREQRARPARIGARHEMV